MENLTVETENLTSVDNGSIENKNQPTVDEVQEWLISYLSQLLDLEIEEISTSTSFNRYGLDSSASISLTSDFGDWLSKEIDPTILYSYPTIEAMAEHFGA
ncbi:MULTISPECIES: acyl carrier protein [Moorena]|uniref:Phosphopantetheine attachment site protein n=1 Tax=Moorena producens 3L TaxID=489825 RepID=F4XRP4_9CYAN|nr:MULTISPECIES: acyl carrier protein [Moorena]AEF01448.1 putative phosphopantetheine attachment site protein [Moorena producens 3L]EGJ32722.1 phosphopantetheine attachment site protein [Moorena producens 3L]NEP33356.1 acyl carrier protein [Moorena sp. SIO3B2]NEP69837.1 acyl carrier protein [Moorena sp. SIO3A5]NER91288.1 acyl carrier protein [Moorena sp. SIO3A2]